MYKNKIMLVTGCNRGIGKEIVNYYARLGVNIIMTYHDKKEDTIKLENDIKEKYRVNIDSYYLDLSNEESVNNLYNKISQKYKKIDYLINNASLSLDNDIFDKTKEEFMKVLEINVVGTFLIMKYFDKIVDGYIFNMSSTDGIDTGSVYSIDYNASKAAINSITKTFSMVSKNRIISICPNWVDTDSTKEIDDEYLQSELKRIGQSKLISVSTIPKVIDDCIKKDIPTGSIIRIEGDKDVRRVS